MKGNMPRLTEMSSLLQRAVVGHARDGKIDSCASAPGHPNLFLSSHPTLR